MELPTGPSGKRRQWTKGGFRSAKAAAEARAEILAAEQAGTLPTDGKQTVGAWLTEWLDGKVGAESIRATTEVGYRGHVENYLVPYLGHLRLIDLRPHHVTKMLIDIRREHDERIAEAKETNERLQKEADEVNAERQAAGKRPIKPRRVAVPRPFSPATAQRVRATLRSAINAALRSGEVSRNVAALAEVASASRPRVKVWEPEQLGEFLDAIAGDGERLYPMLHLAAFAGLRRGELCGLRWCDVDLDARTVDVAWQRTSARHKVVESRPKTDGSESMVDIDEGTAEVLRAWRKQQIQERLAWGPAWQDTGLVFTREDGSGVHPDFVTYRFEKLVARHGLPRISLHKLRHLAASLQLAAGVDIAIVSKRLRHSSIKITNDTYGHLIGTVGRDAAEAAAALVPLRHRAKTA
nr:site-specific integrase [Phytohabitans rumicis]